MHKSSAGFRAALLTGWVALTAAGLLYAREKDIPTWAALPVLAAILFEYSFYLVPGFETVREWIAARYRGFRFAVLLALSALPAYLCYGLGTGQFQWLGLLKLLTLALAITLWYEILPRSPVMDIAFLCLLAAVVLLKVFSGIYPPPVPGLRIEVLGQVMLIRLAAMVMLTQRRVAGIGFGFVPNWKEWRIGIRNFLYFLPVGFPIAVGLGVMRFDAGAFELWKVIGTFFGILWVVALSEEFLFRGLLQQWIGDWTGRPQIALLITAVLFGLVHLPFRTFPNWKFAMVAMIAGWFYGRAYRQASSIRAAMVSHALVVTTWRALFV